MTNYDKLINTLKEVFMLDKAELDFGIYRIMNQKRKDIEQFLEVDLVPQVHKVLSESLSVDKQALQKELDDAIKSAQALGADPNTLPKVQDLKKRLGEAADMVGIENEVFSLLANFFKRYFDNGDFISMRRYKKDVYAIPYEGEEVKLHWANADQYYIKTSEYFKVYRFKLANGKTVAFELIEASTEQNNNKTQGDKERRFAIYTEKVCETIGDEFKIYFTYEPADKIDPMNRVTPQNRELIAQGTGNLLSGFLGGLPITSVIVRSAANAEAGGKTRLSAFTHGLLLLLSVLLLIPVINMIPYCVLSVILIRTGYNLAKPSMIYSVYRQGREQFLPFIVTVISILLTDLLIGVLIGLVYAIYFLIKHTYRAGFTLRERREGSIQHITIDLALNVSFLNKKPIINMLDKLPEYAVVEINGTDSVYIDGDVLEVFQDFRSKATIKHIQLTMKDIPEVETIELH